MSRFPTRPEMPLDDLLNALEMEGRSHDEAEADRRLRRLNLERPTAQLVQLLILSGRRQRVLEVGTSTGVSTLWIADALRRIPGASPLVTIEREPAKAEEALGNFARAGLANWVEVRVGDAAAVVAGLSGPFDAVFLDADRVGYPSLLPLLAPRLAPDALLMADNALSHPDEIRGYLDAVARLPGFTAAVVPVGKGLHIAHRLVSG